MAATHATEVRDGVCLVQVHGDIDIANADALREGLRAAVDGAGTGGVRVDLAQLTFLDARGLGSLIVTAAYAACRRVCFTVVNTPASAHRIMLITGTAATLGVS